MRGTTLFWENVAIATAIPSLTPLFRPSILHCGTSFMHLLYFQVPSELHFVSFASPPCEEESGSTTYSQMFS